VEEAKEDDEYKPRPEIPSEPVKPGATRYVSSITIRNISDEGTEESPLIMNYDARNRVVKMKVGAIEEEYNITYAPDNVVLSMLHSDAGYSWSEEFNGKLGGDGYVHSGTAIETYTQDGGTKNKSEYSFNIDYNNGYIAKVTRWEGQETITLNYTWTGGNITRVNYTSSYDDYGGSTMSLEYGNVANNPLCNLDINALCEDLYPNVPTAMLKLLGKPCEKMVSKITYTGDDFVDVYNYAYEVDAQGFVTKITETYPDLPGEKDEYIITYR
jgi:hypothetical protein